MLGPVTYTDTVLAQLCRKARLFMSDQDVCVSDTDEMTTGGGSCVDRSRKLGEFKPTNVPLSAVEIEKRKREDWTGDAEDLAPLPERKVELHERPELDEGSAI